jgi:hypothetical protein
MAKTRIPVVGSAYEMRATQYDAQTSINWYLSNDPNGKYPTVLLPRPGLKLLIDDDNNKSVRGIFALKGRLYAVIDNGLYDCASTGRREKIGSLLTAVGRVFIIANPTQLFITDGLHGYVYQHESTAFAEAGEFKVVEKMTSKIDKPIFNGAGVDDLKVTDDSIYTGDFIKLYRIEIDGLRNPDYDTFKWSDNGGESWEEKEVPITGLRQELNDGIFIRFDNLKGHDLFDIWDIQASPESEFYVPLIPSYQDTYGIYPRQNTNIFYITRQNDFSSVNSTEKQRTQVYPDNLQAAISIHDELYLIGTKTTEIWYDTAAIEFPFERKRNIVLNYGTEAPYTVASGADNVIFMLGSNYEGGRVIIKVTNYNVIMISTEPLNEELRGYSKVDDAFAYIIDRNGHVFYIITFPSEDKTWVYDYSLSIWHEWKSRRYEDSTIDPRYIFGRFRGNCHTVFEGQDVIGDTFTGKIFTLTEESSLDYDEHIMCERTTQNLNIDNQYISINSFQLDFEAGRGTVANEDPQVMLQISKDGGQTWGSEFWRSLGRIGQFKKRVIWYRLGTARNFVFRIKVYADIYRVLMGAIADLEVFD